MRRRHSRAAAAVTALAAGGLAAFSLRPSDGATTAALAARNPPAEVRTQVIRRTIHIIRHEPGARLPGSRDTSGAGVQARGPVRSGASGSHRPAPAGGSTGVATRTSGSHGGATGSPTGASTPVSTRTSGSHGPSSSSAPAGTPVSTRSSGSHGGSSGGSSAKPVTRSSSSEGHGDGSDGGDGHRGGDN